MEPPSPWKRPDEVMQIHRLKKRKKALQERMKQPSCSNASSEEKTTTQNEDLNFSRILDGEKRKNPFSKNKLEKKAKLENENSQLEESSDNTLFALLRLPAKPVERPAPGAEKDKLSTFSNLLQKYTAEHAVETIVSEIKHKNLPIDWALKTKVRLMSPKPFPWTQKLKASEEASGITGFVRCIDTTTSPTLDTSPRARFHQTCLYWQHPHLPWMPLFPRSAARAAGTSFIATNEEVKQALHTEWTESFRSLFQLVRARHCPYFYLCANSLTCLFVAGGVCGVPEPSVLLAPSTRGLRQLLRQDDIEYTMPLRPDKKKLNNSEEAGKNSSFDSCYDTMESAGGGAGGGAGRGGSGDEDEGDDCFLTQLGLENDVMKRINNTQARIQNATESNVDNAAESLVLVQGVDAQALFNFLLNCKSVIAQGGSLAGAPPTLIAPTAFHGATLQALKVRESVIHSENTKYYSLELRGPVLPTALHSLLHVVRSSSSEHFSATCAHLHHTLAFSWALKAVVKAESSKENEPVQFSGAFNKENLSDCGISEELLRLFCSSDPAAIRTLDGVKYSADDGMWIET